MSEYKQSGVGTWTYGEDEFGIMCVSKFVPENDNVTIINFDIREEDGKSIEINGIGDNAFADCKNLKEIIIPESIQSIGYGAFSDCTSLTKITIPNGIQNIDGVAFLGCSSLKEITISKNVQDIGDNAFSGCNSLSKITISDSSQIKILRDALKNSRLYFSRLTVVLESDGIERETIILGNSNIQNLEESNFKIVHKKIVNGVGTLTCYENGIMQKFIPENDRATKVDIPEKIDGIEIQSIDMYAFYDCSSLTEITISNTAQIESLRDALRIFMSNFNDKKEITVTLKLNELEDKVTIQSKEDIENLNLDSFNIFREMLNNRRKHINIKKFFGTIGIVLSTALAVVPAFFFAPIIAAAAFVAGLASALVIGFTVIDNARIEGNEQDLYVAEKPDKSILAPDMRRREHFKNLLDKCKTKVDIRKELAPKMFGEKVAEEVKKEMDLQAK